MSEGSIKVSLKPEYKHTLPFSLGSRCAVATIFSYFGPSDQVFQFMQAASHKTRAYIHNNGGLPGFLVSSVTTILRRIQSQVPELEVIQLYHRIDLGALIEQLEEFENESDMLYFLGERYPALCVYVMTKQGKRAALDAYMAQCQACDGAWEQFSTYIHGYWHPHLDQLKAKGLLKQAKGSAVFEIGQYQVLYEGLVNAEGQAYGQGIARRVKHPGDTYTGTFKENCPHGIGNHLKQLTQDTVVFQMDQNKFVTEQRMGQYRGYQRNHIPIQIFIPWKAHQILQVVSHPVQRPYFACRTGVIENCTYSSGRWSHTKDVTNSPQGAYYTEDGRALTALDPNWEKYTMKIQDLSFKPASKANAHIFYNV